MKKILFTTFLGFLITSLFFILPIATSAYYDSGGFNIGLKAEVSKDDANWYNYTADNGSGGQTLVVSPCDTLTFRLKTWNEGDSNANSLEFAYFGTNGEYLDIESGFYNDDLDNNGTSYDGSLVGSITLPLVSSSTNESSAETGTYKVTVKENTPDQTLIQGAIMLTAASGVAMKPLSVVYAQGFTESQIRILVSNPQATSLPQTGASN